MPGLPRTSRNTHVPLFVNDLSECATARVTQMFMPGSGRCTTGAAIIVYGLIFFITRYKQARQIRVTYFCRYPRQHACANRCDHCNQYRVNIVFAQRVNHYAKQTAFGGLIADLSVCFINFFAGHI